MSKVLRQFHKAILESGAYKKFFAKLNPGDRIYPNKVKDAELRYDDAGEEFTNGYKNIYLQVNSEAKNSAMKKFKSRHGTHANIATAAIKVDVPEDEQEAEVNKMLADVAEQYSKKVG